MTKPQKLKEEWIPCPPGTLSALAGQEQVRQRRMFLIRTGSTVGAIALASGAGWLAFRGTRTRPEPTFGGIACSKVRELAPQFMMAQLDDAVTQQIKTHLEQCVDCRNLLESMQPKTAMHRPQGESSGHCSCPTCRRDGLNEMLAGIRSPKITPFG